MSAPSALKNHFTRKLLAFLLIQHVLFQNSWQEDKHNYRFKPHSGLTAVSALKTMLGVFFLFQTDLFLCRFRVCEPFTSADVIEFAILFSFVINVV